MARDRNGATKLPSALERLLQERAPTYLTSPADGPYKMTCVIGSWPHVSWREQAHVDYISEMANRRLWSTTTRSRFGDNQP